MTKLSRCTMAAAVAAGLLLVPARADSVRPRSVYRELCRLIAVWDPNRTATSVVAAPQGAIPGHWSGLVAGVAASTITVNYDAGFDPNAKIAFQKAVDIWASQIASPVPIIVDAHWHDLGNAGLLGSAGATFDYTDFGAGVPNTYYPSALANKLAGVDIAPADAQNPSNADIEANFNSAFTLQGGWYFGTDGQTPLNKYDFESVVLHELGHGLGFSGSASDSSGSGSLGYGGVPLIYDRFVEDAARHAVLNTAFFPNPSVALHNAFTSDGAWTPNGSGGYVPLDPATGLYWNGTNGVAAGGGSNNRPRLDAQAPFSAGSNYSHLNEVNYPPGSANSLMTRFLSNGEVIHNPGPIMLGMFVDEGWSLACTYTLSQTAVTVLPTASTGTITVTAPAGCGWTAAVTSSSPFVSITGGASGTGTGTVSYSVAAAPNATVRSNTLLIAGTAVTVSQGPILAIDHATLRFGAISSAGALSNSTSAQSVAVSISGATGLPWTAAVTSTSPWLVLTGGSGTGSGSFAVGVQSSTVLAGRTSVTGTISVAAPGTSTTPKTIAVTLTLLAPGTTSGPIGSFDTPADGSTVAGSIAVIGWALDDIEVVSVEIQRDANPGDPAGAVFNGKVSIGNASFVEGARPDVEAAVPTAPLNYRAGWGYLMLTRGLIWDGKGPFKLYAVITDKEGNKVTLPGKTIIVDNAASNKPFGSIDTPTQGGTTRGTFANYGWALTPPGPGGCTIPANGVQVSIDSGPLQAVTYGDVRTDIAGGFTGFSNSASAGGHYVVDTTALANGTHTIGWLITDNCGHTDGVGSRFFRVQNSSLIATTAALTNQPASALPGVDSGAPIRVATGFTAKHTSATVRPDAFGRRHVRIDELARVEMRLASSTAGVSASTRHARYAAYLVANGQLRALPVGTTFDARRGVLAWQPGAGYVGDYEFVMVDQGRRDARRLTRVIVTVGRSLPPPTVLRMRAAD